MINNVSFAGRETMLTAGLEKAATKAKAVAKEVNVVKASSVLPQIKEVASKVEYTSPYAPTEVVASVTTAGKAFKGAPIDFFA